MNDFSEWLQKARSDPGWEQLPVVMRQHLAMQAARSLGPLPYVLTVDEAEVRARLAEEDPEAGDLYARWITVRLPEPDLGAFDQYRALVAAAAVAGGRTVANVYCEQCGKAGKGRQSLGRVLATPHGLLFEAKRPFRDAAAQLRQSGVAPAIANKAHTMSRVLLNPEVPDPGQVPPAIHCDRHGEAIVAVAALLRAARSPTTGKVVVRCAIRRRIPNPGAV